MRRTALAAVAALTLLSSASVARAGAAPGRLDALLAASSAALGLARSDAQHLTLHAKVTVAGIPGTATEWDDLRSGINAAYTDAGPLSGAAGFDGSHVWNEDAKGVVWDDGAPGAAIKARQDAYVIAHRLWAPQYGGAAVALHGERTDRGRRYDVVEVTLPATPPFELWIDATSHLPARIVRTIGRSTTQTEWSDYHPVGRLRVPYSFHATTPGGDVAGTVTNAAVDVPDAAAHLARPVSHPDDFSIAGAPSTTFACRLAENHVYVDATIDGKGPFHLIFDTGGANVLDVDVAKALGLRSEGSARTGGVGAATEAAKFATVTALTIGDATLTNQIFAVTPVHGGFGVSGGRPVDGLIGFEVLARFVTTFDYQNERITLRLPDAPVSPMPTDAAAVPFTFDDTTPAVPCAIDTIPGTCTIDTGSRDSFDVHAPFVAAHPGIVPANATQAGVGGFGIGGPLINRLGRTTLAFGPFTLPGTITGFTAQDVGAFADPFVAGNIGAGVLKRFSVTFDYPRSLMTLVPNGEYASPDVYERSGMFLIDRGGAIVVAGVRPGTPAAEAGIVKDDTIASVDGRPASALGLDGVRRALAAPASTGVRLDVTAVAGGATKTVTLTLRDYV